MQKFLCIYCASSDRVDPKYFAVAEKLGSGMAAHGWGLVYGGGKTGLMGAVARATKAGGGRVVGVIPEFMIERELAFAEADELITVRTMSERKMRMEARADAFLALPGGWGTLEEILEILTLKQLSVVLKPAIILNQEGYYDELLRLFDRMIRERFSKEENRDLYRVARDVGEVFSALAQSGAGRDCGRREMHH